MKLYGRTCIITGASRGLGKQIAERFWREGASLLLVARTEAALSALTDTLAASGRADQKVAWVSHDLGVPGAVSSLVAKARDVFDSLTVLVNNAAIQGPIGPIWENNWKEWECTIRVDLLAPAALCALVIPWMSERGYGKIINLSGGGATGPRPNFTAYATAKTGLVRLTEVLAYETRGTGIDVNCIAPGAINTQMLEEVLAAGQKRVGIQEYARTQRQSKQGSMPLERAAKTAVFLASSESDSITGRLISAVWDPWETLPEHIVDLKDSDIYTLRRIVPKDRGKDWG